MISHNRLLLTNFRRTINILDGKDLTQSEEQHLGQCRYQLRCRHEDIHTVLPLRDHIQTLHRQTGPIVRRLFNLRSYLQPLITFRLSEEATDTEGE